MFPAKHLLVYLALAFAAASVDASAGTPVGGRMVDHRMIRKRAPQLGGLIGVGETPPKDTADTPAATPSSVTSATSTSTSATSATSKSAEQSSNTSTSASSTSATSATSSSTSATSEVSSSSSSASSSSASSSSSSTSASVSSSSVSSSASSSSTQPTSSSTKANTTQQTPAPQTNKPPVITSTNANGQIVHVTATLTTSAAAASSTETDNAKPVGAAAKTTFTVLGVIAACVGGVFLLWTVIRKWKFRPSKNFEDRLQPIDWQPTEGNDNAGAAPNRRSVASSFHSSGHSDENIAGRGVGAGVGTGGYGATGTNAHAYGSDHGHAALPDHDFTAPAASLAPGAGYADLARGPSPQPYGAPQMAQYDHAGAPAAYGGYSAQQHQHDPYAGYTGARY